MLGQHISHIRVEPKRRTESSVAYKISVKGGSVKSIQMLLSSINGRAAANYAKSLLRKGCVSMNGKIGGEKRTVTMVELQIGDTKSAPRKAAIWGTESRFENGTERTINVPI